MKFSHINAGRWDEKLEGGMKSSFLHTCQIKNNRKRNPCWRQAIVIVWNYGLEGQGAFHALRPKDLRRRPDFFVSVVAPLL